jgi:hypothetical protein
MTKPLKDFWRRIGDFLRNGDVGSSLTTGPADFSAVQARGLSLPIFHFWPDRAIPDC